MGYQPVDPDLIRKLTRRVLISGPPNSGKTTSLRTWPKPMAVVSFPGELGVASLPIQEEGIDAYAFGEIDVTKPVNWIDIVEETRRLMADLTTKGTYQTVAGDGLHKLYHCYLNMVTVGKAAKGEAFDGRRAYPAASALFFGDLRLWIQSGVPFSPWTVWIGRDKDDPTAEADKASTHIFPALPGQAGQDVVGEFALCVYAERQGQGQAARYVWLTKPDSRVWGVGAKLPLEIATKLPQTISPQAWSELEKWLG